MTLGEMIKVRQEYNYKILDELKKLIDMYPDQRFGQILFNYTSFKGDHDPFYDESVESYNEILKIKNDECK